MPRPGSNPAAHSRRSAPTYMKFAAATAAMTSAAPAAATIELGAVNTSETKAAVDEQGTVTTGRASNAVSMTKNAKPCGLRDSTPTTRDHRGDRPCPDGKSRSVLESPHRGRTVQNPAPRQSAVRTPQRRIGGRPGVRLQRTQGGDTTFVDLTTNERIAMVLLLDERRECGSSLHMTADLTSRCH